MHCTSRLSLVVVGVALSECGCACVCVRRPLNVRGLPTKQVHAVNIIHMEIEEEKWMRLREVNKRHGDTRWQRT